MKYPHSNGTTAKKTSESLLEIFRKKKKALSRTWTSHHSTRNARSYYPLHIHGWPELYIRTYVLIWTVHTYVLIWLIIHLTWYHATHIAQLTILRWGTPWPPPLASLGSRRPHSPGTHRALRTAWGRFWQARPQGPGRWSHMQLAGLQQCSKSITSQITSQQSKFIMGNAVDTHTYGLSLVESELRTYTPFQKVWTPCQQSWDPGNVNWNSSMVEAQNDVDLSVTIKNQIFHIKRFYSTFGWASDAS